METVKRLVMNPPPAIGYRELTELHSVAMQSMMGMRHEPLTVKDVGTFIIAWTSDNISSALPVCFVHALSEEAQIVVLTQTVGGQLEVLVLPMAKLIKYARTTASHPSENLDHAIRPAENEIVFFGSNYLLKEFCQVDETTRLSTITAAQSIGAKRNGFLFEIWYGETRWVFYRTLNSFDRIVHTSLYSCLPSLKKAYNTHIECLHCLLPGDQVWLSSPEDFLNSLIAIVEEKLIPQNFEEFTYQVDKIMIPKSPGEGAQLDVWSESLGSVIIPFYQAIPVSTPPAEPVWTSELMNRIRISFEKNPPPEGAFKMHETVGGKQAVLQLGEYRQRRLVAQDIENYYIVFEDFD